MTTQQPLGEGLLTRLECAVGCSNERSNGRITGSGYVVRLQARGCHGEACVDLGVHVLPLGFEVEGCGGGVFGGGEGHGAHTGLGCAVGLGVLGADVGEFDEGGEGGAECFGVFAGTLDGFAYGLLAGLSVDG